MQSAVAGEPGLESVTPIELGNCEKMQLQLEITEREAKACVAKAALLEAQAHKSNALKKAKQLVAEGATSGDLSSADALPLGLQGLEMRIKRQIFFQLNQARGEPALMVGAFKALKLCKNKRTKKHQADAIARGIERGKNQPVTPEDEDAAKRKTNAHTLDQWVRSNHGPKQANRTDLLSKVADAEIGKAMREFSEKAPRNLLTLDEASPVNSALEEHVNWIVSENKGKITHTRPQKTLATPTARAGRSVVENLSMLMERVTEGDLSDARKMDELAQRIAQTCLSSQSLDLSEFLTGLGHRRNLYDIPVSHLALAVRAVPQGTFTRFVIGFNLYK